MAPHLKWLLEVSVHSLGGEVGTVLAHILNQAFLGGAQTGQQNSGSPVYFDHSFPLEPSRTYMHYSFLMELDQILSV